MHDPPASRTLAEDQIAHIHKTQSQGNERPGSCSNVSPATVGAKPTLGGQSFQERWVLHLPAGRVSLPQAPTLMCHRTLRHLTVLSTQPGPSTLGSEGTDLMSQSVPAPDCASGSQGPATHLCCAPVPLLGTGHRKALWLLTPGSAPRMQVQLIWPSTTGYTLQGPQILKNWSPKLVCQGNKGEPPPAAMCGAQCATE